MDSLSEILHLQSRIRDDGITQKNIEKFRQAVKDFYRDSGRDLPWRNTRDPYRILVSEIMLQQTQVERVKDKYVSFIERFPDFKTLSRCTKKTLLKEWQGMGYNRRALYLRESAQIVCEKYNGKLPADYEHLITLPGIGPATAADILVFGFNKPHPVIETNVRTVYITLFFPEKEEIADSEIRPLVEQTMDTSNPRDWFNALMDVGSALKKVYPHSSRKSAHYVKQSPFKGSNRQVRSSILKLLLKTEALDIESIAGRLEIGPDRISQNVKQMSREGMIRERGSKYYV